MVGKCGLVSYSSGLWSVTCCCEHGNQPSDRKFLDYLSDS